MLSLTDAPPPGFDAEYVAEVTTESYKELKNLALWAKSMGPEFCVIGGWAAWQYHRGLGSRDIDVIFLDWRMLDAMLRVYYERNAYETYGGLLSKRRRKRVVVGGKTVFIEIDAASVTDRVPFKEDRNRSIPYAEVQKHSVEWDVGPASVRIPVPELLILQKTKAWRDRTWDLEHTAVEAIDVQHLRGKIWKDEYDIRAIAKRVTDPGRMWEIAERNKCRDLIEDAFVRIGIRIE
ncbi:MAG: hypothetical protein HY556_07060 [Euryarchaeota archaeon]|nr:hypothetical protein [Euryarchaeota archaeon]